MSPRHPDHRPASRALLHFLTRPGVGIAVAGALVMVSCNQEHPVAPAERYPTQLAALAAPLGDPGFETGGAGWQNVALAGRTIVASLAHGGSHALQISANRSYSRTVYQDLQLGSAADYDVEIWVQVNALAAGARLELLWLNAEGLPEILPPAALLRTDLVGALSGTAGWTRLSGRLTAPAGAVAVRLNLAVPREADGGGTAWFDDALFAPVTAPPTDSIAPSISITAPVPGAVMVGLAHFAATATDSVGVTGVQFTVDGAPVGSEVTGAPWELSFNTATLSNGPHTIAAIARDAAGNHTTAAGVAVQVQQPQNLMSDPGFESGGTGWRNLGMAGRSTVTTSPHSGARAAELVASSRFSRSIYQDVAVAAGASFDFAVWVRTSGLGGVGAGIELLWLNASGLPEVPPAASILARDSLSRQAGTQPWTAFSRSTVAPPGSAVLRVIASVASEPDNAGAAWFDDAALSSTSTPPGDVEPPTVALTFPAPGSTLSGYADLVASASDDVGVAGVQFQVDGANLGAEALSAPFRLSLDTPLLPDGDHVFTAIARDQAGNHTTSLPVAAHVKNIGRPNVVIILSDDQRYDLMPYLPLTTALLQDERVDFAQAFATTPLCCPTRASLLTGLYSHNTGVLQNYLPNGGAIKFDPSSTIATWLMQAGYRTGLYGKYLNAYHLISPAVPPGWSEFHAFVGHDDDEYYNYTLNHNGTLTNYGTRPQDYSTDELSRQAVQFITSTPATRPLLLYFTPYAPHEPATPALGDIGKLAGLPHWRPASYNEADVSDKPAWLRAEPLLTAAEMAAEDAFHESQLESMQALDRSVSNLVAALKQSGRWNSTLLVFAGDNGLAWGEHRLRGKDCVYEECVRVPLWIRLPGQAARVDSSLVGLIDLAPTIAAWVGTVPATRVNGRDLLPLLACPAAPWRSEILLEELGTTSPTRSFQGVRTARYLYAEYQNGDRELYDLTVDRDQLDNVVTDPANAATIATLEALLANLRGE